MEMTKMIVDKKLIQEDVDKINKRINREQELSHNNVDSIPIDRLQRLLKVVDNYYLKPIVKNNNRPQLKLTRS